MKVKGIASQKLGKNTERLLLPVVFNPLTAGVAYIRVFIFYQHIKNHLLNTLKIQCDINQHYLDIVDLHFVKSELFSLTPSG